MKNLTKNRNWSRTRIKGNARKKSSFEIKETINIALKNEKWFDVAKELSKPTRQQPSLNLQDIEKVAKDGETIIIPGKIVSTGEITKKIKLRALSISKVALEKLNKSKIDYKSISEEILSNKEAKSIRILR